ncbi:MAG: DUF1697 domain-containing protein [Marmoricola sp.]
MPTHLGFLRAVNVGKRQFKTADLRACLEAAGYADVDTYIQTGNIRVSSPLRSRQKLEAELESVFLADRGFEVPTIVMSPAELRTIAEDVAEIGFERPKGEGGHYVNLMKAPIAAADLEELRGLFQDGVTLIARGRALHLLYEFSIGQAAKPGARAEKLLGVATNRSAKVVTEMVERWC